MNSKRPRKSNDASPASSFRNSTQNRRCYPSSAESAHKFFETARPWLRTTERAVANVGRRSFYWQQLLIYTARQKAAINCQDLSIDEAGSIRSEEDSGANQFVGLAKPLGGNAHEKFLT